MSFDQTHYVPILKGRAGEYGALQEMSAKVKAALTPMIEVPPIPWDFTADRPAKTIDEHLKKVTGMIARSWGQQRPLFLDLLWIAPRERLANGEHPLAHVFRMARGAGLQAVPVTGLERGNDYQLACRDVVALDQRGLCVRLQREDFEDTAELTDQVSSLLQILDVTPPETDLMLDLRALGTGKGSALLAVIPALVRSVPQFRSWRSFTLAVTAFPEDLMGLPPSSVTPIPRMGWGAWRSLIGQSRLPRAPTFADYAISHPQPSEVDPRIMRPSASIRYTANDAWLILKGRNLRDYGYAEFYDVCRDLVAHQEYSGPSFSWGDRYIQECSARHVGTGNLTTWRKVGTSHHLAFVVRQIANLTWP